MIKVIINITTALDRRNGVSYHYATLWNPCLSAWDKMQFVVHGRSNLTYWLDQTMNVAAREIVLVEDIIGKVDYNRRVKSMKHMDEVLGDIMTFITREE